MTTAVTIDLAGGQLGGAARYRTEVNGYLDRRARDDIKVIGARRQLSPAWLAAREASGGAAKPPGRAEQRRVPHPWR